MRRCSDPTQCANHDQRGGRERNRLRSQARGSGWNLAANPSPRALARLKKLPLAPLLLQASHADRVIKGILPGDAWNALTGLTGAFAGALQAGGI